MPKQKSYQENFIEGVRKLMADHNIPDTKSAAKHLDIPYMSLYKIMDRSNKPTVAHCITLCIKAGYSANWLFLNKGDLFFEREVTLQAMAADLASLRKAILPITKSLTAKK